MGRLVEYSIEERVCVVGDEIRFTVNNINKEISEGVIVGVLANGDDRPPAFEIKTVYGILNMSIKNLHRNTVYRRPWDSEVDRDHLMSGILNSYSNNEAFKTLIHNHSLRTSDLFEIVTRHGIEVTKSRLNGWSRPEHDRRFVPMGDDDLSAVALAITLEDKKR